MPFSQGYAKLMNKARQIIESVKPKKFLPQKEETSLPYAYPCENYIGTILSNELVRKVLKLFADKHCKEQIQYIQSTGQLVTKESYPRLHETLQSCYDILNIKEAPEVYITNQLRGINALSVGTDKAPIILISRKAVISLSDEEIRFMIGHELGHILQKNLMCHTIKGVLDNLKSKHEVLGPIVADTIDVPLNQWHQCAEYTADRAGFLCCKDIASIEAIFNKTMEVKSKTGYKSYIELYKDHPFIQSRIDRIKQFAASVNM